MDLKTFQVIPVVNYVRMTYAAVVLTKLYFSATSATSEIGKFLDQESLEVSQYLDRLVLHLMKVIRFNKNRVASKFLMILIALKKWFSQQRMRVHLNSSQSEQIEPCFFIKPSGSPDEEPSPSPPLENLLQKQENLLHEGNLQQSPSSIRDNSFSSTQRPLLCTQSWETAHKNHNSKTMAAIGTNESGFHDPNSDLLPVPNSSSESSLDMAISQMPDFNDDILLEDINDWIMNERLFDDINATHSPGMLHLA